MLIKLAARNVRRSARDYAIYFITIALGVAMFYAFNTIQDQAVLFDAFSAADLRIFNLLGLCMGVFSGAVALTLGFLVVYANRFLIRRRRREFGMYLMLGMGAGRVSTILLVETLLVGFVSLLVGLVAGILLSQVLSFATAALMGTFMSHYRFLVSWSAIGFTVLCFAGIFAVSAIIDIIYIRRCKLASLLSTHEGNERTIVVHPAVRVVCFVCSLAIIACSYWQLAENGLVELDWHFVVATVLMVVGTCLFFWSLMGTVVAVLSRSRGVYYRGLSMFTVRQISSKMNTAFASMSIVCIMLFFALAVTSIGMGLVALFVGDLQNVTQYDASIISYTRQLATDDSQVPLKESDTMYLAGDEDAIRASNALLYERYAGDMAACLADNSATWNSVAKASAQADMYYLPQTTYGDLIDTISNIEQYMEPELIASAQNMHPSVISVSQFNATSALVGGVQISLADDEYAVNNQYASTEGFAEALRTNATQLNVFDKVLHCVSQAVSQAMRTSSVADVAVEFIVPDTVIELLKAEGYLPQSSVLDVMYSTNRVEGDTLLNQVISDVFENLPGAASKAYEGEALETQHMYWPVGVSYTAHEMTDQANGLKMVITYLAVYIGFVLLMAAASILSIQQLSETSDSRMRYRRLATLGCSQRMRTRSLLIQTLVYFLVPLGLAACHASCVIYVVNDVLFTELGVGIMSSTAISAGVIVVLYVLYMLITYFLSKSMLKEKVRTFE